MTGYTGLSGSIRERGCNYGGQTRRTLAALFLAVDLHIYPLEHGSNQVLSADQTIVGFVDGLYHQFAGG